MFSSASLNPKKLTSYLFTEAAGGGDDEDVWEMILPNDASLEWRGVTLNDKLWCKGWMNDSTDLSNDEKERTEIGSQVRWKEPDADVDGVMTGRCPNLRLD